MHRENRRTRTATRAGVRWATHVSVVMLAFTIGSAAVAQDFDGDADVDLTDFTHFQACFNGPNHAPATGDCADADTDVDADVDLTDFVHFQTCFNGPNRPPRVSHGIRRKRMSTGSRRFSRRAARAAVAVWSADSS